MNLLPHLNNTLNVARRMKIISSLFISLFLIANTHAACPTAANMKGYYSGMNTTTIFSDYVAKAKEQTLIRVYMDGKGTATVWGTMTLASMVSKNTYSASASSSTSSVSSMAYKYNATNCSITQKVTLADKSIIYYTFLVSNGGYKLYGINNDQISSVTSPTYYVDTMDWWKE